MYVVSFVFRKLFLLFLKVVNAVCLNFECCMKLLAVVCFVDKIL